MRKKIKLNKNGGLTLNNDELKELLEKGDLWDSKLDDFHKELEIAVYPIKERAYLAYECIDPSLWRVADVDKDKLEANGIYTTPDLEDKLTSLGVTTKMVESTLGMLAGKDYGKKTEIKHFLGSWEAVREADIGVTGIMYTPGKEQGIYAVKRFDMENLQWREIMQCPYDEAKTYIKENAFGGWDHEDSVIYDVMYSAGMIDMTEDEFMEKLYPKDKKLLN